MDDLLYDALKQSWTYFSDLQKKTERIPQYDGQNSDFDLTQHPDI